MSNPFTKSLIKLDEKAKRKISYSDEIEYAPPPKNFETETNPSASDDDFENYTSFKPEKLMQKIVKNERDLSFYLAKNKEYSKKASGHLEKAMKITEKLKLISKALETVLAVSIVKSEEPSNRKRDRPFSNEEEEFNRRDSRNSLSNRSEMGGDDRYSRQDSYSRDDRPDGQRNYDNSNDRRRSYDDESDRRRSYDDSDRRRNYDDRKRNYDDGSDYGRDNDFQNSKRRNTSNDYTPSDRYSNKDVGDNKQRRSRESSVSVDGNRNQSSPGVKTSGFVHPDRLKVVEHDTPPKNAAPSKPVYESSTPPKTIFESSILSKPARDLPRSPQSDEEIVLEGDIYSDDDGSNLIPFQEQLASYVENQLEKPPPATVPFDPTVKEWEIKSSGSRQTLNNLKSIKLTNFGRNARDVLVQEETELAFASPNDGSIQVYDLKARSTIHTITPNELKNSRSEAMEWITDDVLIVASNYEKLLELTADGKDSIGAYELHQLAFIHDCEIQTLGKNKVFTNKILHVTQFPHTKNITTIGKMPLTDNIRWLTGGNDKLITLWTHTGGTGQVLKTQRVHFEHTNGVTSIYYQDFTDTIFSGGKDKRLIGYNLERDKVVTANGKNDQQIRSIIPIPGQKHLLLVSFIDKNSTLKLYDTRLQIYVSQWHLPDPSAEAKAPSLYQKPSIHKNGNLVSIGDCMSDIHIWDLRYANYEKTPSQVISTHRNRVMGTKFYDRQGHSLLSWCTNNDFYMTNYT
ncbi:hypothetical protein HDV04_002921 [Boothiomyces sp. JEL0838]|nr:hypothetical protein HDV04_002921 [Boothiomyces sp. JEL0838]